MEKNVVTDSKVLPISIKIKEFMEVKTICNKYIDLLYKYINKEGKDFGLAS